MTRNFTTRTHYDVGSLPPASYVAWHFWADDQHKGGLRQMQCAVCGLWKFPQEACVHSGVV